MNPATMRRSFVSVSAQIVARRGDFPPASQVAKRMECVSRCIGSADGSAWSVGTREQAPRTAPNASRDCGSTALRRFPGVDLLELHLRCFALFRFVYHE